MVLYETRVSFHYSAAFFAGAQFLRAIEFTESGKEIFLDVIQMETILMKFVIAFFAIPDQAIFNLLFGPFGFNHQSYAIGGALRAVGYSGRQQEHFAFLNRNINR